MAVHLTNAALGSIPVGYSELWEHYTRTQFLYPAKLEQLAACRQQISQLWPRLLNASPQVFQVHCAAQGGEVASSLSCFRDSARRFVIQHAASSLHPDLLIECLLSMTVSVSHTPAEYSVMYYRDAKHWPSRLQRILSARQGSGACDCIVQDYLHAEAAFVGWPPSIERLVGEVPAEAMELLRASWGSLRLKSLGLDALDRGQLSGLYQGCGLSRTQHVLAAMDAGRIIGIACIHLGSAPMNLSFLCNRVEIAVSSETANRDAVAKNLLTAARQLFAEKGALHFVALLSAEDNMAAQAAGYHDTGRQYSSFLWSRDGEHGFASTAIALARWFETLGARSARQDRRKTPAAFA